GWQSRSERSRPGDSAAGPAGMVSAPRCRPGAPRLLTLLLLLPLPGARAITCSPPPNITNGMHSGSKVEIFDYNSSVTYTCDHNFSLTGEASIHCTTKDNIHGVWNGSAPECKGPGIDGRTSMVGIIIIGPCICVVVLTITKKGKDRSLAEDAGVQMAFLLKS
ncbi:complement component 4 binding protein alpha, partial [Chelydra serpentina]